jgi:YfiH family protein
VVDLPWTWLRQVHRARVVTVRHPGDAAGEAADAAVTSVPGAALAVHTADCAPVVLVADGVVGVAHAGWKGLVEGVIPAAVDAMRALGAGDVDAVLGPCIHAECYEFGAGDLAAVAAMLGDGVRGVTQAGRPALDVPAAVRAAAAQAGVRRVDDVDLCTSCDATRWFSHRARAETGRQAAVAWLE